MPDTPRFLIRRPTTKKVPQTTDLLSGEIALGYPTGNNVPVLYYKDPLNSDNVVIVGSDYFAQINHNHDGVYQPANNILTGLTNLGSDTGIVVKNGSASFVVRSVVAGSSKVSVSNGNGVSGDISIDVVESAININNLSGTLSVSKGGTGLSSLGTANTILGVNNAGNALEYKTITGTANQINVTHTANTITLSTPQDIATSSSPTFAGLTVNGNITINSDPTDGKHAVTKSYVDALVQGLKVKPPVRVATTGNITLSGIQTIDGVTLAAGDRVLVWKQTNAAQNGVYVVSSGAWSRASDLDEGSEFPGASVLVMEGNTYADTVFVCTNDTPPTLGTTPINFSVFSTPLDIMAGDGLTLNGRIMSINLASNSGLEIVSDALRIKLETSTPTLQVNASGALGLKIKTNGGLAVDGSGVYVDTEVVTGNIRGTDNPSFYINGTSGVYLRDSGTSLRVTDSFDTLTDVIANFIKLKQNSDTSNFATLKANSSANVNTTYALDYIAGYTDYTILTNRSIIDCGTY